METKQERTERVRRCLEFIKANPQEPWHLPIKAAWKAEVMAEAESIGLVQPRSLGFRAEGPDWEGMILARQERYWGDEQ